MPSYIALAIPVFFILIMVEIFVARRQGKAHYYRLNDSITDLTCGIGQQVIHILKKGLLLAGHFYLYENYALFELPVWLMWVVAIVGVDFFYYWWHRLSHEVNFLWAIHVVHHHSEEYNLSVALRQAWFSGFSIWPFYAPLSLLGVHPAILLTAESISTLYQFWIHTRTIGKLGFFEWFFNTPAHHRVHHGRNVKYLDRNYGAISIIWDRIFGSFQEEEEEPVYGTVSPYTSWNPIWANFHYWVDLFKQAQKAPYFVDKIKVWFMRPGWQPRGLEAKYDIEKIIQPERAVRFNTKISSGLAIYIFVNFIFVALATSGLMFFEKALPLSQIVLGIILILFTSLIWGAMFEGKSWAFPAEIFRLILIAAISTSYFLLNQLPLLALSLTIVLSIGFLFWLLRYRNDFIISKNTIAKNEQVATV
ncbi:MAG: sterol desaturase family protein [Acidobacteria bacterium]|nr:sterol desaturase family protein [Acidobacteriota bacterium]